MVPIDGTRGESDHSNGRRERPDLDEAMGIGVPGAHVDDHTGFIMKSGEEPGTRPAAFEADPSEE